MRPALSTLGCSGLALDHVGPLAAECGFAGLELRAVAGEPVTVELDAGERAAVARALRSYDVEAVSVASYVHLGDAAARDADVVDVAVAHGRLATDIGAPYLRIFPGVRQPADVMSRRLAEIVDGLAGTGVTVAVETHDEYLAVADVTEIIRDHPGVALIWDALHPWRAGEPVAASAAAARARLAYVQVKDVASTENLTPLPPGDGVLPLGDMAAALAGFGYDGWVSWEYERAWFPDCPPVQSIGPAVAEWITRSFGRPSAY